jgi:hypothetical protein
MCTANGNCVDIDADDIGISGGEMAGIIIGSVIALSIIIATVFYCKKKHKSKVNQRSVYA